MSSQSASDIAQTIKPNIKLYVKGLDLSAKYTRVEVVCFSDSELLVKHMNGEYRLKNDTLRELFHEVNKNAGVFKSITYQHVKREHQKIQRADKLLNDAHNGNTINKEFNS